MFADHASDDPHHLCLRGGSAARCARQPMRREQVVGFPAARAYVGVPQFAQNECARRAPLSAVLM